MGTLPQILDIILTETCSVKKQKVNICGMIHLNLTVDIHIHHVHRATAPDPYLLQIQTNNRT